MNKKIILAAIVFFIISTLSILCFAEASNNTNTSNTVDLKGEITQSLDKTRNTTSNVTNGVVSGVGSVMNTVTNGIDNITGMNNGTDNKNNSTTNNNNAITNNGSYNTTRTGVGDAYYGAGNQMDTTTWLWMILAIVAVIIVGAVWYYAMQGVNDRNDEH